MATPLVHLTNHKLEIDIRIFDHGIGDAALSEFWKLQWAVSGAGERAAPVLLHAPADEQESIKSIPEDHRAAHPAECLTGGEGLAGEAAAASGTLPLLPGGREELPSILGGEGAAAYGTAPPPPGAREGQHEEGVGEPVNRWHEVEQVEPVDTRAEFQLFQ